MKELKEYRFKWNDNAACRDRGCFGSRDDIEELTFLAYDEKDAIIKAMNIVSENCIFTEWDEELLENAHSLSLQELRECLEGIDISGGSAFIYWIKEVETNEPVFESGYEEDEEYEDEEYEDEEDEEYEDEIDEDEIDEDEEY